jgi:hypothetical protein
MLNIFTETPLVAMYKTEFYSDYQIMLKNGIHPTDDCIRVMLGHSKVARKKVFGIF